MFPLLLRIKEPTASSPEEAALATVRAVAAAAGDPSAELRALREHALLCQTKRSSRPCDFLVDL